MQKLHVVVASTRPGRAGLSVAKWAHAQAEKHAGFAVELVDLAEQNLPIFDEPNHPRQRKYEHAHTKAWSAKVDAADAFVIVTPEYNFSSPPALVNAFHYLSQEWEHKPLGFVSYGGISGGLRSVQMTKLIVTALNMMPIPQGVTLPSFSQHMKDGVFAPPEPQEKSMKTMLDELARWSTALATLRQK
jgi:NAD(P)H-dependent FMN reductase